MQKGKRGKAMNPRLEELRKRLLPSEPAANPDAIFTRSSQSAATDRSKQTPISAVEAAERNSDTQSLQPAEPVAEQRPDSEDGQVAEDAPKSMDQRTQTFAALFEPPPRSRQQLPTSFHS